VVCLDDTHYIEENPLSIIIGFIVFSDPSVRNYSTYFIM
jgi:hypothetical protein